MAMVPPEAPRDSGSSSFHEDSRNSTSNRNPGNPVNSDRAVKPCPFLHVEDPQLARSAAFSGPLSPLQLPETGPGLSPSPEHAVVDAGALFGRKWKSLSPKDLEAIRATLGFTPNHRHAGSSHPGHEGTSEPGAGSSRHEEAIGGAGDVLPHGDPAGRGYGEGRSRPRRPLSGPIVVGRRRSGGVPVSGPVTVAAPSLAANPTALQQKNEGTTSRSGQACQQRAPASAVAGGAGESGRDEGLLSAKGSLQVLGEGHQGLGFRQKGAREGSGTQELGRSGRRGPNRHVLESGSASKQSQNIRQSFSGSLDRLQHAALDDTSMGTGEGLADFSSWDFEYHVYKQFSGSPNPAGLSRSAEGKYNEGDDAQTNFSGPLVARPTADRLARRNSAPPDHKEVAQCCATPHGMQNPQTSQQSGTAGPKAMAETHLPSGMPRKSVDMKVSSVPSLATALLQGREVTAPGQAPTLPEGGEASMALDKVSEAQSRPEDGHCPLVKFALPPPPLAEIVTVVEAPFLFRKFQRTKKGTSLFK